jgi:hypothetical protein
MKENGRAVLVASIDKLPSRIGWIDMPPENVQQALIGYDFGVIVYLDRFQVPAASGTDIIIGGVFHMTTGIAGYDPPDPFMF